MDARAQAAARAEEAVFGAVVAAVAVAERRGCERESCAARLQGEANEGARRRAAEQGRVSGRQ